jgi:exopolysaccharide biosynthesis WecB/TagA/CpsF family protein
MAVSSKPYRIRLGGTVVDLMRHSDVVEAVRCRIRDRDPDVRPLAVGSANLDHVHHFGSRGVSRTGLEPGEPAVQWLVLLDGVPLVRRAARLTGQRWPQLAGSDLLPAVLDAAADAGARVGFLGGAPAMHQRLRGVLAHRYPRLRVAGLWSPEREGLLGAGAGELARTVRAAGVDLLVVGLGKPRQEWWIQRHAGDSGARVFLGFGAATDFLAGTASRAPAWMRRRGVEWMYRLAREPRRLTRRYCVQGPAALWWLWTDSGPVTRSPRSALAATR